MRAVLLGPRAMFSGPLYELAQIIVSEYPGSTCTPCCLTQNFVGAGTAADLGHIYVGLFTCVELEDVSIQYEPNGATFDAVPGVPQTFSTILPGSPFMFVGYRIYTPSRTV